MSSSRDIGRPIGNRVQILMRKRNGILNYVIAAQLGSYKKKQYKIFGRGTDYQAAVKKDSDVVVRSRRQLVKADV